jgi:Flp pilus assembly protein TadD
LQADGGVDVDLELALFEADHGDPARAVAMAQAAYDRRPTIYGADGLAWALYRGGDYAAAWPRSQEALRLGTRDALLYFHAGMIADALGDTDAARAHLQQALDINPAFSLVHAATARETLAALAP